MFSLKFRVVPADGKHAVERLTPSRQTTRILVALALGLSVIVGLAGPRHDHDHLVGAVAGASAASADVVPTTLPPLPVPTTLPPLTVPTVPPVTVPGVTTPTTLPALPPVTVPTLPPVPTTLPVLPIVPPLPVPTTLPVVPGLPPLPLLG